MNIQTAKDEIVRSLRAYTGRKEDGSFRIPVEKQRPLLLIGPPGIGKTAIMKQIAAETGVGLVSYTMTHHTRQSAIGLPFISEREYGGRAYSITEYTMSEIVASIYDYMEATGKREGILFLDEINCVSETLAPVMLQLLQNKTFGNHAIPEGWVIVAAGNPPEYNKSVRELDMVTLDRVKHMEIEPDLEIWQTYAREQEVHPAVRTYLTVYPDHFYNITTTDRGQQFVTARGWDDLSMILKEYEAAGEMILPELFLEYLQHDEIARSFGLYYDLFRNFLAGSGSEEGHAGTDGTRSFAQTLLGRPERLAACTRSECLAIAAILCHGITDPAGERARKLALLDRVGELNRLIPAGTDFSVERSQRDFFDQKRRALEVRVNAGVAKPGEEILERRALNRLEQDAAVWLRDERASGVSFPEYEERVLAGERERLDERSRALRDDAALAYEVLAQCKQGAEARLYLTTDLSRDPAAEALLQAYPCEAYLKACRELLA